MAMLFNRLLAATAVAGAVVVSLLAVLAVMQGRVEPARERRADPARSRPAEPEPAPPTPEEPTPAPVEPLALSGTTRFVRRLEAGTELRRLKEEDLDDARLAPRLGRVLPHLLAADGPTEELEPSQILDSLTEPPRDLARLTLAGRTIRDPLGAGLGVRVWTLGDPFPDVELADVSATLDQIIRCTGRDVAHGFDILVTPESGSDVFPLQPGIEWAVGVYFVRDGYCVARAGIEPEFRREVVEHELVHAYLFQAFPSFSSSPFVNEGLADYLRLLEPGDDRLNVPAERVADACTELGLMLKSLAAHDVNVTRLEPGELVGLAPQDFYALRHLGYLFAQVTMAFLGGEKIERALASGSDVTLTASIRAIRTNDFFRFVTETAKGGRAGRTRVVTDMPADGGAPVSRDRDAFAKALRKLRADSRTGKATPDPLLAMTGGDLGGEKRIAIALEVCRTPKWGLRVYADLSEAMDRQVRLAPVPETIAKLLGRSPEGTTPRAFATDLVRLIGEARPGEELDVTALAKQQRRGGPLLLSTTERFEPGRLRELRPDGLLLALVIIGSDGLARHAVDLERPVEKASGVVLVVDLSNDRQGLEIARALDTPQRVAVYWRPLAD